METVGLDKEHAYQRYRIGSIKRLHHPLSERINIMAGELEKLLTQFAARRDLDQPRPDQQGHYSFLLDGSLRMTLFQTANHIYLEGYPGSLPEHPHQAGEFLSDVLRKHFASLGKSEEVLSMDPVSGELVLFRRLPARTLGLADLEKGLEAFVNRLEFWTRELLGGQPRPTAAPMHILFP